jgi:CRISPR-associated endonuclease/helicase Cas3
LYISRIAPDEREQLTKQHLHESAGYAQAIGCKFSVPEMSRVTALLHDVGKFSSEFVTYLRRSHSEKKLGYKSTRRGSVIHTTQGARYLYEMECNDLISALAREIMAICIANHHSSLMDVVSPYGDTPFHDKMRTNKDSLHYSEVLQNAANESITSNISVILDQCKNELKNFIMKCKSNNLNTAFMIHLLTKSIFSCLVDADRFNAYCFEINEIPGNAIKRPPWEEYANRLEQKISTFKEISEIDRIRRVISEHCLKSASLPKGIYRLDVPTGGGKTLSSLRFALKHAKIHGAEHVIYVLPYLSVLEQTAEEIKNALQYQSGDYFILEHHSNYIVNDSEEMQIHKLLTNRWDSEIIITTMAQFLESIYSCRSSDLRKLHNMANAVFVFDEVQSIPMKCIHLFNEAVNYLHYCAGSSILLCTATQPPLNETEKPVNLTKANFSCS